MWWGSLTKRIPKAWTNGRFAYEHLKLLTQILDRVAGDFLQQARLLAQTVDSLKLQVDRLKLVKFCKGEVDQTYLPSFSRVFDHLQKGSRGTSGEEADYNYPELCRRWVGDLQDLVRMADQAEDLQTAISNHLKEFSLTYQLRFDLNKEEVFLKQLIAAEERNKHLKKQDLKELVETAVRQESCTFLRQTTEIAPLEIKQAEVFGLQHEIKDSLFVDEKFSNQKKSTLYYATYQSQKPQLYTALTGSSF